MYYSNKNNVNLETAEEWNEVYKAACDYTVIEKCEWKLFNDKSLATHSFLVLGEVNISITTKWYNFVKFGKLKPCTYHYRLDGVYNPYTSPVDAHAAMSHYYHCPDIKDIPGLKKQFPSFFDTYFDVKTKRDKYCWSYSPLLQGCKDEYIGKTVKLWSYDLNSAYTFGAIQPVPNFDKGIVGTYMTVPKGHIGFLEHTVKVCEPGQYADVVFELMESPYKAWANRWFKEKRIAGKKGQSSRKTRAKAMMNFAIGYLQIVNPLMRAAILYNIECILREDLLEAGATKDDIFMINTDAIYSTHPLALSHIGNDIGEYKIEHEGVNCTMSSNTNHQFEGEKPKFRGVITTQMLYIFDESKGLVPIDV